MKCTEVNHGNKFVEALKEQYDYDVIKAREDYENSMKDFPVAVFDFANLEKVKRLQGLVNLKIHSGFLAWFLFLFFAVLWAPFKLSIYLDTISVLLVITEKLKIPVLI